MLNNISFLLFRHYVVFALSIVLTSACVQHTDNRMMTVEDVTGVTQSKNPVIISVQGGRKRDLWPGIRLTNREIQRALVRSVLKSRLFRQVIKPGSTTRHPGHYKLRVRVISIHQDKKWFTSQVRLETAWSLTDHTRRKVLLRKSILTTHRISHEVYYSVYKRRRRTMEIVIRKNIREGLIHIARLKLP